MTIPYGAPDLEDNQPRVEDVIEAMTTAGDDRFWLCDLRAAMGLEEDEDTPEPEKALDSDSETFHAWLNTLNHQE